MKYILSLLIFTQISIAQEQHEPFSIPRSVVVDIAASNSDLVYPLFIKLPKFYSQNIKLRYPVIYLTDAPYAFQIVSGATRYPMNIGKMQDAIIVGISYSKGSKSDYSRVYDYTPTTNNQWKKPTGGADQFITFIETDVFKYIDENYRTKTTDRAFVGNSLGGLLGAYILLKKPHLFNNYVLGSPSFWFDNKTIFKQLAEFEKNKIDLNAKVFISIGERESKEQGKTYDMVKDTQVFFNKIEAWNMSNLTTKLLIIPQANHQTAFPTTAIQGLYWIFQK